MWAKIKGIEFEIKTKEDLALLLGEKEKPVEVVVKAKRHYTPKRNSKVWTAEEDAIVLEFSPKKAKRRLHGRTLGSIYVRRGLLKKNKPKGKRSRNLLTDREQKYIKDSLAGGKIIGQIAKDLGKAYSTINSYVTSKRLRS